MKNTKIFAAVFLATLLAACNTNRVVSDYNVNTQFEDFKTYQLVQNEQEVHPKVNPFDLQRVENALHAELANIDYQRNTANPDLEIHYFVTVEDQREVYTNTDYIYGRRYIVPVRTYDVVEYEEGTLIIDFVDTKTNKVVWHGAISGRTTQNKKHADKNIREAVKEVIEKYSKEVLPETVATTNHK